MATITQNLCLALILGEELAHLTLTTADSQNELHTSSLISGTNIHLWMRVVCVCVCVCVGVCGVCVCVWCVCVVCVCGCVCVYLNYVYNSCFLNNKEQV